MYRDDTIVPAAPKAGIPGSHRCQLFNVTVGDDPTNTYRPIIEPYSRWAVHRVLCSRHTTCAFGDGHIARSSTCETIASPIISIRMRDQMTETIDSAGTAASTVFLGHNGEWWDFWLIGSVAFAALAATAIGSRSRTVVIPR